MLCDILCIPEEISFIILEYVVEKHSKCVCEQRASEIIKWSGFNPTCFRVSGDWIQITDNCVANNIITLNTKNNRYFTSSMINGAVTYDERQPLCLGRQIIPKDEGVQIISTLNGRFNIMRCASMIKYDARCCYDMIRNIQNTPTLYETMMEMRKGFVAVRGDDILVVCHRYGKTHIRHICANKLIHELVIGEWYNNYALNSFRWEGEYLIIVLYEMTEGNIKKTLAFRT